MKIVICSKCFKTDECWCNVDVVEIEMYDVAYDFVYGNYRKEFKL